MIDNLALGKPTISSSHIVPYSASRAVNGLGTPMQRWLSNTPCWMGVDLEEPKWINRCEIMQMAEVGWSWDHKFYEYMMYDFKLQGSKDGSNWFDIDFYGSNNSKKTECIFPPVKFRYIRVVVNKGLFANMQIASIVELMVFEALPTSAILLEITLSSGRFEPTFSPEKFTYSANVDYDVDSINVIPIAEDTNATIKVNGVEVKSGETSETINLGVGSNTIKVEVTSQVGGVVKTYTVDVTRASNAYLSDLEYDGGRGDSFTPTFSKDIFEYTAITRYDSVKITPTAENNDAKITVDNQKVQSGDECTINVGSKPKTVTIEVSSAVGSEVEIYNIVIS